MARTISIPTSTSRWPADTAGTGVWIWVPVRRPPATSSPAGHRVAITPNPSGRRCPPAATSIRSAGMKATALALAGCVLLLPAWAFGIDHKNLDEGRPLRLDDAYAISTGEIEIEMGAG